MTEHLPYTPQAVTRQAQSYWHHHHVFGTNLGLGTTARKFYCLSMFPYPSGALHIGHVRNYSIGDAISHFQRMRGMRVFQPMGFDAFGLPAENAALAHKIPPKDWTQNNISAMRTQMEQLGFGFDWSRTLQTCDPSYYRWEQWLFLEMLERGLAYRQAAEVNWDPVDETVLANEQVIDGRGWRSNAPVERRKIEQWFLRITAYADELLAGLDDLRRWPESVKSQQRNWIGKSHGLEISFPLAARRDGIEAVQVFTTRGDTLMGAVAVAVAPDHPLVATCTPTSALTDFLQAHAHQPATRTADAAKHGVPLGVAVLHPLTGARLPVWVTNFVLSSYGTGAVMMVPAHDQRDWECARDWGLPVRPVIAVPDRDSDVTQAAETRHGVLINSGRFDGLTTAAAIEAIHTALASTGASTKTTTYRLRDWGVSRQRYWGTPIPVIHCPACGVVPVPREQLPVELPPLPAHALHDGVPSLADFADWQRVPCPTCGGAARRDTDTFDTFVESSWYQARYLCHDLNTAMCDTRAKQWLPVDQYIGGIEHAILHLLYARFVHKVMRDIGQVTSDEPFARLLTQGMVLKQGAKMSKSRGNTVSPQEVVARYGADAVRMAVLFAAPPEQDFDWDDCGIDGCSRFLHRFWRLVLHARAGWQQTLGNAAMPGVYLADSMSMAQVTARRGVLAPVREDAAALWHATNVCLRQVTHDLDKRLVFNTAIAAVMTLCKAVPSRLASASEQPAPPAALTDADAHLLRASVSVMLQMLAPMAPHITHALWQACAFPHGDPLLCAWPQVDPAALATEVVTLAVQVNGKLRGSVQVPADADKDSIVAAARQQPRVQPYLTAGAVKKTVVVPGRVVNFVVSRA